MAKKLSPSEVMRNLTIGYWVARLVHVAAKLKLADFMKKGPRTIEDLAAAAGVQPQPLYRILSALASVGVFAETKNGRFTLTPLAATFQTGVPASMHACVRVLGSGMRGLKRGRESFTNKVAATSDQRIVGRESWGLTLQPNILRRVAGLLAGSSFSSPLSSFVHFIGSDLKRDTLHERRCFLRAINHHLPSLEVA